MLRSLEQVGQGGAKELGHSHVVRALVVQELCHCHVVRALLKELGDSNVVLFEHLRDGAVVKKEVGEGCLEELGDSDVVGLEELGGGRAQELDYGVLEVLVGWQAVRAGVLHEVHLVEELGHGDVIGLLVQELGHRDVVVVEEFGHGRVEELGHSHVVGPFEELSHRDVVLQELRDGGVEVLIGSRREEERGHVLFLGGFRLVGAQWGLVMYGSVRRGVHWSVDGGVDGSVDGGVDGSVDGGVGGGMHDVIRLLVVSLVTLS